MGNDVEIVRLRNQGKPCSSHQVLASVSCLYIIVLTLAACGGVGTESETSFGGRSPNAALDIFPNEQVRLAVIDLETLLSDQELELVGEEFIKRWQTLETLGIFIDRASLVVESHGETGTLMLIEGRLEYEGVRDKLYSAEFDDEEYRNNEVWTGLWDSGRQSAAASFLGDSQVIVGWPGDDLVKDSLRTKETGRGSFADKPSVDGMANQLPSGNLMLIESSCARWGFRDCTSWGRSMSLIDEFTAGWTWVFVFEGEREARFNVDDIEAQFQELERELDLFDVRVSQNNLQFVIVNASQDKEDAFPSGLAAVWLR